jgi:hypothetical protein
VDRKPTLTAARHGSLTGLALTAGVDGDIHILRVDGDTLTKVGNLALPGHPASMRGSTP